MHEGDIERVVRQANERATGREAMSKQLCVREREIERERESESETTTRERDNEREREREGERVRDRSVRERGGA